MKDTIKYLILILIYLAYGVDYKLKTIYSVILSCPMGCQDCWSNAIYKDSEGFVWLGTDNCLDRFDGVKVRHFEFRVLNQEERNG